MIQHGYEMDFTKQNFGMIIYGAPGIGKTTLALSDGANGANTLLIDAERGVGRLNAVHRMNASVLTAGTYEDIQRDLRSEAASAVETIVIDTCGAMVDYLKDWAFRTKQEARTKSGTFNAMKGFGIVKNEIESVVNYIKNVMHKNIIYIFHADEKVDKDGNLVQRLRCDGSFRNTVWTGIDFGCYVQMVGNQRVACFSPEQEFSAKGCHGIEGQIPIPVLTTETKNDFVAKLFEKARANMQAEQDALTPQMEQYEAVMQAGKALIDGVTDLDTANTTLPEFQKLPHALTSKSELHAIWNAKCKQLGLFYDRVLQKYTPAPDKPAKGGV